MKILALVLFIPICLSSKSQEVSFRADRVVTWDSVKNNFVTVKGIFNITIKDSTFTITGKINETYKIVPVQVYVNKEGKCKRWGSYTENIEVGVDIIHWIKSDNMVESWELHLEKETPKGSKKFTYRAGGECMCNCG